MNLPAQAQQWIRLDGELNDYVRLLEVDGGLATAPLVFRSPSALAALGPVAGRARHIWADRYPLAARAEQPRKPAVDLLDPAWRLVYNSRYPRTANDGALWAGRGASTALNAGARLRWGPLTAVVDPTVYYAQNRDFDVAPTGGKGVNRADLSPFAYAWQNGWIDWPERFGDQEFAAVDWGQSGVHLDVAKFAAGLSTENMWWGPAALNPIVMSNTASGFPHVHLGTGAPVWVGIGHVEARALWGRLAESAYFDTIPANDGRFFSGLTLGIQPRWVPGLTLGATRVFYQAWDSLGLADYLAVFQSVFKARFATSTNPQGNDARDQMLSLSARWAFPDAGFEAYVEWARNDHNVDLRDFLVQPDHSRGYTLGFQQVLRSGDGRVRLRAESTTLGRPATFQTRVTPTFYLHHIARQGYTHKGQLLGAAIGPGSQSQSLAVDRYDRRGRVGLAVQRIRFDDDAYYRSFAGPGLFLGQQTELTATLSAVRFVGPLDLSGSLAISRELNRHYEVKVDVTNAMLDLGASWRWRR